MSVKCGLGCDKAIWDRKPVCQDAIIQYLCDVCYRNSPLEIQLDYTPMWVALIEDEQNVQGV